MMQRKSLVKQTGILATVLYAWKNGVESGRLVYTVQLCLSILQNSGLTLIRFYQVCLGLQL